MTDSFYSKIVYWIGGIPLLIFSLLADILRVFASKHMLTKVGNFFICYKDYSVMLYPNTIQRY